jgi:hypothetical protein
MLQIHYAFGFLVVLASLAAIVLPVARRVVVYALLVQVVLGGATWILTGVKPPAAHWILAILVGGVYAMANAFERKGRPKAAIIGVTVVGALVVACIFYLGMHAVAHPS